MRVARSKKQIFGGIDGLRISLRMQRGEFIGSYDQHISLTELVALATPTKRVEYLAGAMYDAIVNHMKEKASGETSWRKEQSNERTR